MSIKKIAYLILALAVMLVLFSCKSAREVSEKHLIKSIKADKAYVIDSIRKLAPCITKGTTSDSTKYKTWRNEYDSIIKYFEDLEEVPPAIPDTIRLVEEKECPAITSDLNYYKKLSSDRKVEINALLKKIDNIQPIHDTTKILDSADVFGIQDKLNISNSQLAKANKKKDHYFIWAVAASILFLLAVIAALLLSKFKKATR